MKKIECNQCGAETSNLKFCSRSCANTHNNLKAPKRKLDKRYCKKCKVQLKRKSYKDRPTVCKDCSLSYVDWSTVTYGEATGIRNYQKNSRIRDLARKQYFKDGKKECYNCGYDKHIEVCHIKGISEHSHDTLISEINSKSNLVALCRNCHWELDHNLLSVSLPRI